MIALDEQELICDLAQTYGIYDYKSLPVITVAAFCAGLKDDSRIKMKINNMTVSFETSLLAMIFDKLSLLVYSKTEDAKYGFNKPKLLTEIIFNDQSNDNVSFSDGTEFELERTRILEGLSNG